MQTRIYSSFFNENQNLFQFIEWKPESITVYWMETRIYSSLLNGNQNLFQFIERKPEYIPVYWMVWLWVCLYEKNMSLKISLYANIVNNEELYKHFLYKKQEIIKIINWKSLRSFFRYRKKLQRIDTNMDYLK